MSTISKIMVRIAKNGEEFARIQLDIVNRDGSISKAITMADVAALALSNARMTRAILALNDKVNCELL